MAAALPDKRSAEFYKAESFFGIGQAMWYAGKFNAAIDTVKLSLEGYRKIRATANIGSALRILSNIYDDQGDYENAFKTSSEALEIFKGNKDDHNAILSLVQMGALYKSIGDYETAMHFYNLAADLHPGRGSYPYRELHHRIGDLYAAQAQIGKARSHYQEALVGNAKSKIVRLRLGDVYLQEGQYQAAFNYYDSVYNEARQASDVNFIIGSMYGMGKIYLHWNNLPKALEMAEGCLEHAAARGARQSKRDTYKLLSDIYEARGDGPQALQYRKQYDAIKDSVISDNLRSQLFTFRQAVEAQKLLSQRNKLVAVILGISALAFFIFIVVHLRHKNEKLKLTQKATSLEMQALRAQMNPHFIFNCLSSINHFILNNEADKASDYLTRFSRLIRMVLVNAGKQTISLEEELAMLKLYLNMEQLRFKEAFDYYIYFDPGVDPADCMVPSFILQPFCENAIWHGLLHKPEKGQLDLHFGIKENTLICAIRDNGIGRLQAAEYKKAHASEKIASFGNRLTAERLALFNGTGNQPNTSFTIEDLTNNEGQSTGTRIILKIHHKPLYN